MTNREKINKMSNEELARFIANGRCEEFYGCEKQCVPPKEDDIKNITKWFSQEAESSADEMFKELGYEKLEDGYSYKNKNDEIICISKQGYKYLKTLDRFIGGAVLNFITEAEDRAIHKKIEEIENGI